MFQVFHHTSQHSVPRIPDKVLTAPRTLEAEPEQSGLGCTGVVESKQDKIWSVWISIACTCCDNDWTPGPTEEGICSRSKKGFIELRKHGEKKKKKNFLPGSIIARPYCNNSRHEHPSGAGRSGEEVRSTNPYNKVFNTQIAVLKNKEENQAGKSEEVQAKSQVPKITRQTMRERLYTRKKTGRRGRVQIYR